MSRNKTPKSRAEIGDYRGALFLEAVRAAALRTLPPRKRGQFPDEADAVTAAAWELLNPLGLEGRDKVERDIAPACDPTPAGFPPAPPKRRFFTAHSHPNEPLVSSPNDRVRMRDLDLLHGAGVHYVMDGLKIVRISGDDEERPGES